MHEAFSVAQAQGADGQAFDGAGVTGVEHHPVADGDGVFDEDEQPGDHVLHQLLGAEADCQANHPGTGQQRSHVDAQVGHGGDGADHHQDDFDRVAQHRQDGPHAGARLARGAAPDRGLERFLNGRVDHHPEQPGHQQDQADAAQRVADGAAEAVAQGEVEHRKAPDAPQQNNEGHRDGDAQQGAGQIAQQLLVGAQALSGILLLLVFEHVLEHGAEKHRADQQDRGQQGLLQSALALFAGADQVDGRDQDHHQDRQEPQGREDSQGFLHGTVLQAVGQGAVTDQVRHRAA
ncbi:hypothetical protein D3C76_909490 [compost metagenome]